MESNAHGSGVLALPDDILADILRRLRAHSLARCRCVCAPWRGLVDAHGFLRPHALPPRALPGFFANLRPSDSEPWKRPDGPCFLPPPASRAHLAHVDRLAFLRRHLSVYGGVPAAVAVQHSSNGLVLCFQCLAGGGVPSAGFVCNPTTERWARLPDPPARWPRGGDGAFLAFDPAASPHYEAVLLPVPPPLDPGQSSHVLHNKATLGMFMPQRFLAKHRVFPEDEHGKQLLPVTVFSSASGGWRRRLLQPGRCAPGRLYCRVTTQPGRLADGTTWARSAVYRGGGGTMYAQHGRRVLVVLRYCAEGTYDMVKLPSAHDDVTERYAAEHVLGSIPVGSIFSGAAGNDALRYASVDAFRVKVWSLVESPADGDGLLSWTLTHDADLAPHARMLPLLHDAPSNNRAYARPVEERGGKCDGEEVIGYNPGEPWNWDGAGLLDMEVGEDALLLDADAASPSPFAILGCNPGHQEEVVYLASGDVFHVVAYHLGTGKVRYMGRVVSLRDGDRLDGVVAYRPCIADALPNNSCVFPSLKTAYKRR
ncbi:hypothetical protein QOZ80_4AG0316550 [Eleusine coracana subsp. coracana]|nr:hypothetical protein QOZ80_4AG0316550 [Eleusine coracana subsp. coracana]